MDFYQVATKEGKNAIELYPDFVVGRSEDLMVRGQSFYAIWDEERGLWSQDEYDVQRLVDRELHIAAQERNAKNGQKYTVKNLRSFTYNSWLQYRRFIKNVGDNSHELDSHIVFANTSFDKYDYVSRTLPYALDSC